jgi:hypothetical protein
MQNLSLIEQGGSGDYLTQRAQKMALGALAREIQSGRPFITLEIPFLILASPKLKGNPNLLPANRR